MCVQPVGTANVKVYGPAVDAPVKPYAVTYLVVDCKEAGPGTYFIHPFIHSFIHPGVYCDNNNNNKQTFQ